jgi:NADPH2:quinone reductase
MRIWRLRELGNPIDVLHLEDAPDPTPGEHQLRVEIEATGLSFPDVLMCQGKYQAPTPIPFTPGGEWAGRVTEVGPAGDSSRVGERVLVNAGSGLATVGIGSAARAWRLPDTVSFAKAAGIIINYGTTWFALHDRGALREGETLLITGAAGGTGTAAIQLGRHLGARVIAVAGGAQKAELCRSLGADVVIDHLVTPQWVDAVREATGGAGVDVAYDPVGGDTYHQIRRCMAWDGRLLVIGFVGGIAAAPTNHILLKNYSVVGVHWGASLARDPDALDRQVRLLLDLAADGIVDPPLAPLVALTQGAQALQDMADRIPVGKVVVEPQRGQLSTL